MTSLQVIADRKEYIQMMDKYCPHCVVFVRVFGSPIAFELYTAIIQ